MRTIRLLFLLLIQLYLTNAAISQTITIENPTTYLVLGDVLLGQSTNGSHSFTISASGYAAGTTIYVEVDGGRPNFTVSDNSSSGFSSVLDFTCDGTGSLASTSVYVKFAPTVLGNQAGYYITVFDENWDYDDAKRIRGKGIGPEMQLKFKDVEISSGKTFTESTDSTDFGQTVLGNSTDVTYTIKNIESSVNKGNLLLTGTSPNFIVKSGSADFTVLAQPGKTTIGPDGDSTTFTVRFTPSTTGIKTATISIPNNDADENPYYFSIQGEGTASLPTVSSITAITSRTINSASSGGNISSDGGSSVTARGVCWSTSSLPTVSNSRSTDGNGTGSFTSTISGGLSSATKYYVRAYATNAAGSAYSSSELEFWTLSTEPGNASSVVVDSKGPVSINLSWASGSGANGYVVLQRSGATPPTSSGVEDGVKYTSWTLPVGTTVAGETATNSISVSGLTANTQYSFLVIAFGKGSHDDTYNYKTDASLPSLTVTTLPAAPTTQASNLVWETLSASSMGFSWNQGNGDGCIFLMRAGAAPSMPVHGTSYTHSNNFSTAPTLADGVTKVMFFGDLNAKAMLEVINLDNASIYYFTVLGYNGTGSEVNYNESETGGHNFGNSDASALPIELVSFTAQFVNGQVIINWTTATESNNDYFSIERSRNLMEWNTLLTTSGAGNSNSILHYCETDTEPLKGASYYRLRQTDFDGSESWSTPVSVKVNPLLNANNVFIAEGILNTTIANHEGKRIVAEVYSITGQRLHKQEFVPESNNWQLQLPVQLTTHGAYLLKLSGSKETESRVFVY